MQCKRLENLLIDKLDQYFSGAVKDYVVKESTDIPFTQLTIEMTIYNYYVVRAVVESNTIFFSIVQSDFQFQLLKTSVTDRDIETIPVILDREIRLRIPDKYLQAKGW